jgi:hypothetical protein
VLVAVVVAGFARLFLRGLSTFASPWPVHLHAVAFMAWVGLFMTQVWLACTGRVHLPDAVLAQHMSLVSAAVILIFPVAGTAADWRREGRVHAATDADRARRAARDRVDR